MIGTEQVDLLAAEGDEDDSATFAILLAAQAARQLDQRRGAGAVVVGAVVDRWGFQAACHAADFAVAQVVVVSAEDDGLACQRPSALQHADDVFLRNLRRTSDGHFQVHRPAG